MFNCICFRYRVFYLFIFNFLCFRYRVFLFVYIQFFLFQISSVLFVYVQFFLFQISGIAVLTLGIWTKVELHVYVELSTEYYKEAPYILIGVGAGIVLVGSLGCCCTFKGKAILLYLVSYS